MSFTKYKATPKKTKKKGTKAVKKKATTTGTRYTRQYSINLTKSMAAVRSLLKVNKNAKRGTVAKGG